MNKPNLSRIFWAALAVVVLVPSTDAASDEGACREALYDAQEQLLNLKQLGVVTTLQGSALVDEVAGPVCGFSILKGQYPADPAPLQALIREVSEHHSESTAAKPGVNVKDLVTGGGDAPPAPGPTTKLVDCNMKGDGTGTITAYLLGIVLDEATAAGDWAGADKAVDVAGTAAAVSGTQLEQAGTMFVGPVGPLPSTGPSTDSGATCMETTTVVVVKQTCWWLVIYTKCTTTIKTTVSLTLCGADASQDFAGLGLLTYDHSYIVDGDPCDIAAFGAIDLSGFTDKIASSNSVVVSESYEEITREYYSEAPLIGLN